MTIYNIKTDFGAVGDGVADDAPAFVTAGNALAGTTGNELYLPTGTYKWNSNPIVSGRGMRNSTLFVFEGCDMIVRGDGSALTTINMNSQGNQLGGHGQKQNGNNFGKIASVSSGSNTVTLLTLSDHTKFAVNQWILVSGLNIQDGYSDPSLARGYGYPANFQYFEYVQISAIDTGTGVITFTTPLVNSYDALWPVLNSGTNFETNGGGCAGLYSLPITWGQTQLEYIGITFADSISSSQIYNGSRTQIYRDCVFPNQPHPIPSQNQTWACYDCVNNIGITEVDKCITNMIMDNCTWGFLQFQSSSTTNVTLTNSSFRGLDGCGLDCVVDNCTFSPNYVAPGVYAYGVGNSLTISNSSVAEWRTGGLTDGGVSSASQYAQMSGGVIRWPNGVSSVTNITDNGSGKTRYTVFNSGSCWVGQRVSLTYAVQEIPTVGSTASGTDVFTFASVPAWIVTGVVVRGQNNGYVGVPNGATVVSTTATTVTISASTTAIIASGSDIAFECPALSTATTVLAVPDSTHVDVDVNFPAGFVFSYGIAMYGGAARWAVPGMYGFFSGSMGKSKPFKVLGVTQDSNYSYVQTDQPGGWPTTLVPTSGGSGNMNITTSAQSVKATNLSGASPYNEQLSWPLAYNKPIGSYFKKTYTAADSGGTPVTGQLVYVKINVTKAYSGADANLFALCNAFNNLPTNRDGVSTGLGWSVDVKTTGLRTITPSNTVTNPTRLGADGTLLVPTWTNCLWLNGTSGFYLANSTGGGAQRNTAVLAEDPSVWPEVTVEILTDQGFVVENSSFPLFGSLRLHG